MNCTREGSRLRASCKNHPETAPTPTLSIEKLSSTRPVPGAKKARDLWLIEFSIPVNRVFSNNVGKKRGNDRPGLGHASISEGDPASRE